MNRLLFWLCVALWLAVLIWGITICYFSSLTGPQIESMLSVPLWDKLSHFLAYAAGGALLAAALNCSRAWSPVKLVLVSAIALSVFGALDEWHQLYTPLRQGADKWDWLADTLGAIAGSLLFTLFYARRNSRQDSPATTGD